MTSTGTSFPNFDNLRHLIIDMDGVLWHGDQPLPGLVEFFAVLRQKGLTFVLATNNSSRTPEQYLAKLARMGVQAARDEILTSAQATAYYLSQQTPNGARIYTIGEDGIRNALLERGYTLCGEYEAGAQYVVVGADHGVNWDKLASATLAIRAGAKFIGTNSDASFPSERGIIQGNGAILAALATATGVQPTVIGKPEPIMYQQALARLGGTTADTWALGDRLETDILGAVNTGIPSILVLSGVTTQAQVDASDYKPDLVLPGIAELIPLLQALPADG